MILNAEQKAVLIKSLESKGYNHTDAVNQANSPRAGELFLEYCQSFANLVDKFIAENLGKSLDDDGVYGNQCVDLFKKYNREVVGGPAVSGNAIDYWNKYPTKFYSRINNSLYAIPKKGDVVIFDACKALPLGHIGIVQKANFWNVTICEINWPVEGYYNSKGIFIGTGKVKIQVHGYLSPRIKGWLHPLK